MEYLFIHVFFKFFSKGQNDLGYLFIGIFFSFFCCHL